MLYQLSYKALVVVLAGQTECGLEHGPKKETLSFEPGYGLGKGTFTKDIILGLTTDASID